MSETTYTGDAAADEILRLVVARIRALPEQPRADVLDAVTYLVCNLSWLSAVTGRKTEAIVESFRLIARHDLLRIDTGSPRFAVLLWVRPGLGLSL